MPHIDFDSRALKIDGRRTLVISGAVHYPRSTPSMWPTLIARSKEAGLNTIETYVFWNLHERRRGVLDFSDRLDLLRFCQVCQEHGMHMILRIGPYVCAETNFGGLPPWLREIPGLRTRTYSPPFLQEMERFVRTLCEHLRPMFAPRGGPIVMAQLENEYNNIAWKYGEEGQKYLQWCVDLGKSLNLGVPLVQCVGAAEGAIESINGFYAHPELPKHRQQHPTQPPLWTENWPGWYNIWGYDPHERTPENVAYGVARFFAAGGAGVNYYMWHGGTNFGRESMYGQTTCYDFGAPLDEYGLETTKYRHLARLHRILREHESALLAGDAPVARQAGDQIEFTHGPLVFRCDDQAQRVQILENGRPLMDTAQVERASVIVRTMSPDVVRLDGWQAFREPLPQDWPAALRSAIESLRPIEQLSLTHDSTDYCWYSATIESRGAGELVLDGVGDVVHVFIDGKLVASTPGPLLEHREIAKPEEWRQTFKLDLSPGRHRLDLLCCAMGLIKGDWMLGFRNMVEERKGLFGRALWDSQEIAGPWTMQPGLLGERIDLDGAAGELLSWQEPLASAAAPRWFRTRFDRPAGNAPLAVDLTGMGKGLLFLNGRCAGRYWLIKAMGVNPVGPVASQSPIITYGHGEPAQRYYHLPLEWLAEKNTLVLLEETTAAPTALVRLVRRS